MSAVLISELERRIKRLKSRKQCVVVVPAGTYTEEHRCLKTAKFGRYCAHHRRYYEN